MAVGGTQRTIKWSLPLIATKNTWSAVRGILADQKKRTQEIAEVPHTNTLVIFGRTRVSSEYSVPQSVTKVKYKFGKVKVRKPIGHFNLMKLFECHSKFLKHKKKLFRNRSSLWACYDVDYYVGMLKLLLRVGVGCDD